MVAGLGEQTRGWKLTWPVGMREGVGHVGEGQMGQALKND